LSSSPLLPPPPEDATPLVAPADGDLRPTPVPPPRAADDMGRCASCIVGRDVTGCAEQRQAKQHTAPSARRDGSNEPVAKSLATRAPELRLRYYRERERQLQLAVVKCDRVCFMLKPVN
jgi:hypothetical protein